MKKIILFDVLLVTLYIFLGIYFSWNQIFPMGPTYFLSGSQVVADITAFIYFFIVINILVGTEYYLVQKKSTIGINLGYVSFVSKLAFYLTLFPLAISSLFLFLMYSNFGSEGLHGIGWGFLELIVVTVFFLLFAIIYGGVRVYLFNKKNFVATNIFAFLSRRFIPLITFLVVLNIVVIFLVFNRNINSPAFVIKEDQRIGVVCGYSGSLPEYRCFKVRCLLDGRFDQSLLSSSNEKINLKVCDNDGSAQVIEEVVK